MLSNFLHTDISLLTVALRDIVGLKLEIMILGHGGIEIYRFSVVHVGLYISSAYMVTYQSSYRP